MTLDELIEKLLNIKKEHDLGNPIIKLLIDDGEIQFIVAVIYDEENDQILISN